MRFRYSTSLVALAAFAALTSLSAPAAGQAAKTAWGDPDLRGLWKMTHGTPLERPEGVTERILTAEQTAERRAERSNRVFSARDGDPGFYNEFWFEWGKEDNRTAMIDVPPRRARAAEAGRPATRKRAAGGPECAGRGAPHLARHVGLRPLHNPLGSAGAADQLQTTTGTSSRPPITS